MTKSELIAAIAFPGVLSRIAKVARLRAPGSEKIQHRLLSGPAAGQGLILYRGVIRRRLGQPDIEVPGGGGRGDR